MLVYVSSSTAICSVLCRLCNNYLNICFKLYLPCFIIIFHVLESVVQFLLEARDFSFRIQQIVFASQKWCFLYFFKWTNIMSPPKPRIIAHYFAHVWFETLASKRCHVRSAWNALSNLKWNTITPWKQGGWRVGFPAACLLNYFTHRTKWWLHFPSAYFLRLNNLNELQETYSVPV